MDNVLTKKIGPLPAVAWAAIVVGGFVLFRVMAGHAAPTVAASTGVKGTTTYSDVPTSGADLPVGSGGSGNAGFTPDPYATPLSATTGSGVGNYPTDQAWGSAAILHLTSQGQSPGVASNAIRSYLDGLGLTPQQADMVSRAIASVGSPASGAKALLMGVGKAPHLNGAGLTGTPTALNFSWDPATNDAAYGPVHYVIYDAARRVVYQGPATRFTIPNPSPGLHVYSLRAYNQTGGSASRILTATTRATPGNIHPGTIRSGIHNPMPTRRR